MTLKKLSANGKGEPSKSPEESRKNLGMNLSLKESIVNTQSIGHTKREGAEIKTYIKIKPNRNIYWHTVLVYLVGFKIKQEKRYKLLFTEQLQACPPSHAKI